MLNQIKIVYGPYNACYGKNKKYGYNFKRITIVYNDGSRKVYYLHKFLKEYMAENNIEQMTEQELLNILPMFKKNKLEYTCLICGNIFYPRSKKAKYCSKECCSRSIQKIDYPSNEELAKLVWEIPTTRLAIQLGVSEGALTSWLNKRNIKKPPAGYWMKKKYGKI